MYLRNTWETNVTYPSVNTNANRRSDLKGRIRHWRYDAWRANDKGEQHMSISQSPLNNAKPSFKPVSVLSIDARRQG